MVRSKKLEFETSLKRKKAEIAYGAYIAAKAEALADNLVENLNGIMKDKATVALLTKMHNKGTIKSLIHLLNILEADGLRVIEMLVNIPWQECITHLAHYEVWSK
jgi:hypothetical protein